MEVRGLTRSYFWTIFGSLGYLVLLQEDCSCSQEAVGIAQIHYSGAWHSMVTRLNPLYIQYKPTRLRTPEVAMFGISWFSSANVWNSGRLLFSALFTHPMFWWARLKSGPVCNVASAFPVHASPTKSAAKHMTYHSSNCSLAGYLGL